MATIAELMVKLSMDDGAFQRNLRSSREKLDSWGESFRGWGTKLTAGVTTPIVGAGGVVVKWASDLEQTLGATEVLWGDNTDTMLAWAQGADRSMGMTQNSALQNANRFNAMFKTIGLGQGVVMDMSQGFTQLSADLSAMWGGSPDEAADALWVISQGFGPHTREQWLALTRPQLKPDGEGFKPHYDPGIAIPFRLITPELAQAGEAVLWHSWDALRIPVLLLRGEQSDLLSAATAQAMTQRGPHTRLVEFAGVGHAPMLVQPDQVDAVRSFLLQT